MTNAAQATPVQSDFFAPAAMTIGSSEYMVAMARVEAEYDMLSAPDLLAMQSDEISFSEWKRRLNAQVQRRSAARMAIIARAAA